MVALEMGSDVHFSAELVDIFPEFNMHSVPSFLNLITRKCSAVSVIFVKFTSSVLYFVQIPANVYVNKFGDE